ncbi:MAG: hypothetical protein NTX72_00990 [Candidatus Uhrbacteria bacterium]|nr:hypothetical protein [Candidatus Uhrbacteria bacterium]
MWKHVVFEERTFGSAEEVRVAVCAFLSENNLTPADVQIVETRFYGLSGPTANLSVTVYWSENTIRRRPA